MTRSQRQRRRDIESKAWKLSESQRLKQVAVCSCNRWWPSVAARNEHRETWERKTPEQREAAQGG